MILLLSTLVAAAPSFASQPGVLASPAPQPGSVGTSPSADLDSPSTAGAPEGDPRDRSQPSPASFDLAWAYLDPPVAAAQSEEDTGEYYSNLYRKFGLDAGFAAYARFSTTVGVSAGAVGTDIDMEDFLGIKSESNIARLDGHYSFSRKSRLDFSYYDIRRSGGRTIDHDIDFGGTTFPAGSAVNARFDTQIIKLAYRYNFVADYRTVLGASFGVHTMGIDTELDSNALSLQEEFKATAPLPLLGLHFAYALDRKWKLALDYEVLQFDIGDYRGFVDDSRLSIEHDTFEHFGWGIGLNSFSINGEIDGNGNSSADLKYGYEGIVVYLRWFI